MNDKERIQQIVKDLYYPSLIVGSGVMVMHGMEREMGDLDVFMATRNWFYFYNQHVGHLPPTWRLITTGSGDHMRQADPPYLERELYGLKVNIFFCWRVRANEHHSVDVNRLWRESEVIDGVRCCTMRALFDWKLALRRSKDLPDIRAILDKRPELVVR